MLHTATQTRHPAVGDVWEDLKTGIRYQIEAVKTKFVHAKGEDISLPLRWFTDGRFQFVRSADPIGDKLPGLRAHLEFRKMTREEIAAHLGVGMKVTGKRRNSKPVDDLIARLEAQGYYWQDSYLCRPDGYHPVRSGECHLRVGG